MDISTIVGGLGAMLVLAAAVVIAGASFASFLDYPSMMVVFGGGIFAVFIAFPLRNMLSIGSVIKVVFINSQASIPELIETIVNLAEVARRDGLLALESQIDEIQNSFIVLGIQMAVDGTQPEVISDIMRTEMEAVANRHRDGKSLLDMLGKFAPAFGMIGTLMGLIIMLGNMSDPSSIGPAMAVALITTLYGALLANAFAIPFAEKLGFMNKQELLRMEIVIRGIMGIQSGDNPRVIEQKLNSFVPPKLRVGAQEEAA